MREFRSSYQILLSLFDILNVLYDKQFKYYHKMCLKRQINLIKYD